MPTADRTLLKSDSWPAGHRAALAVFVDLDPAISPWITPSKASNEAAADRVMSMLADLDIVPTFVIDPETENAYRVPDSWEFDAAVRLGESPGNFSKAASACQERLGASPTGLVQLTSSPSPPKVAPQYWLMDGSGAPFPERTDNGQVVIPFSRWWQDATWLSPDNASPPSAFLEHLTMSMASVRTRGELMTLYLSAPIAGHPGHVETMQRFLDETIAAGDVWITNGAGIVGEQSS